MAKRQYYKAVNPDLTAIYNPAFRYEIGEWATPIPLDDLRYCRTGYHVTKDVHNWARADSRLFQVETRDLHPGYERRPHKRVAGSIRLTEEITDTLLTTGDDAIQLAWIMAYDALLNPQEPEPNWTEFHSQYRRHSLDFPHTWCSNPTKTYLANPYQNQNRWLRSHDVWGRGNTTMLSDPYAEIVHTISRSHDLYHSNRHKTCIHALAQLIYDPDNTFSNDKILDAIAITCAGHIYLGHLGDSPVYLRNLGGHHAVPGSTIRMGSRQV